MLYVMGGVRSAVSASEVGFTRNQPDSPAGADPGFVERGGGAAAVPFEDPLWNFKRGGGNGKCRVGI